MAPKSHLKGTRNLRIALDDSSSTRKTRTTRITKVSKYQRIAAHFANLKRLFVNSPSSKSSRSVLNSPKVTAIQTRFPSRFDLMLERIKLHSSYSPVKTAEFPYGSFSGRPIIGEYSRINGGVYLSATAKEAIVVEERYGGLEPIYSQLMVAFVRKNGSRIRATNEAELVQAAIELAQDKLTFVTEPTIEMLGQKEVLKPDEKVTLDVFIEHGLGTARHQVLLAGYLLEKLKDQGYLHGKIIIDGTMTDGKNTQEKLVYSSEAGDLYIFEPEENLVK